jgi:mono/diheme cytochrome c family protein
VRRSSPVALLLVLGACRTKGGDSQKAAEAAAAPAASTFAPPDRGAEIVASTCSSCHSDEMLRQQRLTSLQWQKAVKKMIGWGATLNDDETDVVIAYLARTYPVDAGPYEIGTITAEEAAEANARLDDGPFAAGDAERGARLYAGRCASCHGADARGNIGLCLVGRPLLYRASKFAETVRSGRAKMPAQPETSATEVADLLAHLRRLHAAE